MDFFSRLFSTSSSRKRKSPSEEDSTSTSSSSPCPPQDSNPRHRESGAFARESRVDLIDEEEEKLIPEDPQQELESSTSSVLVRTLDRWNPETCVRLLRMPSVQNYSGLKKLISNSDREWMVEFLDMGGLEVLFETVDRLSSRNRQSQARMEHTLLLLQGISCLKAVSDSRDGLEYMVLQKDYARKLATVLCSQNSLVKKQLFELLSTLCIYSEGGHHLTLDVLESYRATQQLRYRFAVLLDEIKRAEVFPYVAAVLALLNCIVLGCCGFRLRMRLRNEILALGLLDLLDSLRQLPDDEVQLHCVVFQKSQLADEEHARSLGMRSSFSHCSLFQALLDKLEDTPLSASFLVLLQNLNQLDPEDTKTDYVWSLLEELTEKAINGSGPNVRSWLMGVDSRNIRRQSSATQTPIDRSISMSLSVEDATLYRGRRSGRCTKNSGHDEDSQSTTSRDSGLPVSRCQSFASSESPVSPTGTLTSQSSADPPESDREEEVTTKQRSKPPGFFRAVGFSFSLMRKSGHKKPDEASPDSEPPRICIQPAAVDVRQTAGCCDDGSSGQLTQSFRSESVVSECDSKSRDTVKSSKTFPFFSRSRKYSLVQAPPKVLVQPPSPDLSFIGGRSPATSRSGMTSLDVKRSRKRAQMASGQPLADEDSISRSSRDDDSLSSYSEDVAVLSRSSSKRSSAHDGTQESMNQLSELTSSSDAAVSCAVKSPPPPPPPPPPPMPDVEFRQRSLNLPRLTPNRSSWSGGASAPEVSFRGKGVVYNTLPRPKSKMKTLNWSKIPSGHANVQSIWSEINQDSKKVDVNFEEFEKLFCQEGKTSKTKSRSTAQARKSHSHVSLLDSKRSLSIGVFLKQFKGGLEQVVDEIRHCRHAEIGAEKLRTLLQLLPNANEVKMLTTYAGDMNLLATAEKFVLRLSAVDHLEPRVEGMLLLEEFPGTIKSLLDQVQSLLEACAGLLDNEGLKNFLKLVLVTGNFMNSDSYAGNAFGFRLATLPKLMETKANRPRLTLLHYLVEEAEKKDKDSLHFTVELLNQLNRCSRLTLESVSAEINHLNRTVRKLDGQVQSEADILKKYFGTFTQSAIQQLEVVNKKMAEISNLSVLLAQRFCEDEKQFSLEECLNVVYLFCAKIRMAKSENKERKDNEEKRKRNSHLDSIKDTNPQLKNGSL